MSGQLQDHHPELHRPPLPLPKLTVACGCTLSPWSLVNPGRTRRPRTVHAAHGFDQHSTLA
eukprot:6851123-Prymnesium_polylepis.1